MKQPYEAGMAVEARRRMIRPTDTGGDFSPS